MTGDNDEFNQTAKDEILLGTQFASLAITDDEEGTLEKVGKLNPWHIEALSMITGSDEAAHQPLTTILKETMDLDLDTMIDMSGVTKGGHFLDTQGYIAHNDTTIVLSYRCTTSAFDWLTNLDSSSSQWEIREDVEKGFSGYCSGFEGLCCQGEDYKPRVHTGFYNNFLATVPLIQEHIDPLLQPDQPPRRLFVCGHSLGAGIASMAACYFLLEHDWSMLPHRFICVTAGAPRSCQKSMRRAIQDRMQQFSPEQAVIYRIVRGRDVVCNVPPKFLGFRHLDGLVYIAGDEPGQVQSSPQADDEDEDGGGEGEEGDEDDPAQDMKNPADYLGEEEDEEDREPESETRSEKYMRSVYKIPKPFRDHMPDFYMRPLVQFKDGTNEEEAERSGE